VQKDLDFADYEIEEDIIVSEREHINVEPVGAGITAS